MRYDGIVGKGTVTLEANVGSTDVFHVAMSASNHVFLQPRTATAAAAVAYVYDRRTRYFTINHDITADTDRIFSYLIIAGDPDA